MSRETGGGRNAASIGLAAVASILVLIAAVAFYARVEVLDEDAFADQAQEALADDEVRTVVARELVVQIAERAEGNLLAARPVLESVVGGVIDSAPFRQLFRQAAIQTHRLLFVRDKPSVAFNLADAVSVIRFGLQSVSPNLAAQIPDEIDVTLLALKNREFARTTLDVAGEIRIIGLVAPIVALLALLGSILLAPDRRTGVLRAAVAVATAGVVLTVGMLIFRARLLAGVVGSEELSDADVRGAVGGLLDAFLGGLLAWSLALAFVGTVVAGAAAVLKPEGAAAPAAELRSRLGRRPDSTVGRALRGAGLIGAGLLVALEPDVALEIAGLLAGAYLVFAGSGELLLLLQRNENETAVESGRRRRTLLVGGGVAAAAVAAFAITLLVLTSGDDDKRGARVADGCYGSKAMCALRLNEAVFAGTHNSFSAADDPGWFIANQRHDISTQLEDGIRLFLIDPHWGIKTSSGAVQTDFASEGRDRNKVAKALPPETLAAAQRLAGGIGLGGAAEGDAGVWLCHTVCEVGATKMSEALADIGTFLDENPGEVAVVFIEPYVPPDAIEREFEEAGLLDRLAVLDRGAPLPTLGELVAADERLVVFTEKDAADSGLPWYHDGFSFIQDTPLGETEVENLSCDRERGDADSPILMLNQWADVFPPQRGANPPFQTREGVLGRARECARQRGLPVGFIAVDHYDLGDLIPSIAELNREAVEAKQGSVG